MHESGCPNRITSLVTYIPKQGCVNTTKKCGVKKWVNKMVEFVAPFLAWKHEAKTAATKSTDLFTNLFTTRLCNGFTLSHQICPRIFHHMFHHAFSQSCSQRVLTVGVLHTYSPDVCWCSSYPTNFVAIQKRPGKCQKGHVQSSCSGQKKRNKVRNPTVATRGRPDHPGGRKQRRRGQNQKSKKSPKIHSATGPP